MFSLEKAYNMSLYKLSCSRLAFAWTMQPNKTVFLSEQDRFPLCDWQVEVPKNHEIGFKIMI